MFNQKGQGSLEYLLILGGAILVAVIIIAAITSLPANNPAAYTSMVGTCQTASLNQTVCESVKLPASGLAITTGGAAQSNCDTTGFTTATASGNTPAGAKTSAQNTMACCWKGTSATNGTCTIDKTAK
jgi:uncharacterized protein (UPF0333 family)